MVQQIAMNHTYVIIMAGGEGTRLAPHSTPGRPKQFKKGTIRVLNGVLKLEYEIAGVRQMARLAHNR